MNISLRLLPWLACVLIAAGSARATEEPPLVDGPPRAGFLDGIHYALRSDLATGQEESKHPTVAVRQFHSAAKLPGTALLPGTAVRTAIARTLALSTSHVGPRQSEPNEKALTSNEGYVTVGAPYTRCGKFFVLETRKYGEFEVKQVHVAFLIAGGVAVLGLYYSDLAVVLDENKKTPVLLQARENPGLKKDTIKLSRPGYEEAKACLPPPEAK